MGKRTNGVRQKQQIRSSQQSGKDVKASIIRLEIAELQGILKEFCFANRARWAILAVQSICHEQQVLKSYLEQHFPAEGLCNKAFMLLYSCPDAPEQVRQDNDKVSICLCTAIRHSGGEAIQMPPILPNSKLKQNILPKPPPPGGISKWDTVFLPRYTTIASLSILDLLNEPSFGECVDLDSLPRQCSPRQSASEAAPASSSQASWCPLPTYIF